MRALGLLLVGVLLYLVYAASKAGASLTVPPIGGSGGKVSGPAANAESVDVTTGIGKGSSGQEITFSVPDTSAKATVADWAEAIARFESGYGTAAGLTGAGARNNNPGNLRVAGDLGVDPNGFGKFSSVELGYNALLADLNAKVRKYPDWTLRQVMERYAPVSDGNPSTYADVIANDLGVSPSDQLQTIFGGA